MLDKLKLIAILTAIPLLGFFVMGWAHSKHEQQWRLVVQKNNIAGITAEKLEALSLQNVCAEPQMASKLDDACSTEERIAMVQTISLWTVSFSLVFLVALYLVGQVCRTNRRVLLAVFAPGLYVSNFAVVLTVIMQGLILMTAIYYGETAVSNRVHLKLILVIGLGALVGAYYITKATFGVVKKAKTVVLGQSLTKTDHPQLWDFVHQLAYSVGSEPPHNVGSEQEFVEMPNWRALGRLTPSGIFST